MGQCDHASPSFLKPKGKEEDHPPLEGELRSTRFTLPFMTRAAINSDRQIVAS